MPQILTNNLDGLTITSPITTSATQLFMSAIDLDRLPTSIIDDVSTGDYILLTLEEGSNIEIIKVYFRTTGSLTCTRAQEGTTAFAFTVGASISGRYTAGTHDQMITNVEEARGAFDKYLFSGTISKTEPFVISTSVGLTSAIPDLLFAFSAEGNTSLNTAGAAYLSASNDAGTLVAFYDGTDILICSIASGVVTIGTKVVAPTTNIASMTFLGSTLIVLGDPSSSEVGLVAGTIAGTVLTWGAILDLDSSNTINMSDGMGLGESSSSVTFSSTVKEYKLTANATHIFVCASVPSIDDSGFTNKSGIALLDYTVAGTTLSYSDGNLIYETQASGESSNTVAVYLLNTGISVLTTEKVFTTSTTPFDIVAGTDGNASPNIDITVLPFFTEIQGTLAVIAKSSASTDRNLYRITPNSPPVSKLVSLTAVAGLTKAGNTNRIAITYDIAASHHFAEFTIASDAGLVIASSNRLIDLSPGTLLEYSSELGGHLAVVSAASSPAKSIKYAATARSGDNFFGASPETYTSVGNHPIYPSGNIIKGLSGLSRGIKYFIDDLGNYTTIDTGTPVGIAVTSTDMLLK